MTQATPEQLAGLFKAIADPLRLEILRVLSRESFSVQELCAIFGAKQSGMSHHLKVLAKESLVGTRREGNFVFYLRSQPEGEMVERQALLNSIFTRIDAMPLSTGITDAISQVQAQRAELSQAFFTANAGKFRAQQELIATFDQYSTPMIELLDRISLPQRDTVLEIGPGHGAFLAPLSERFRQVVALDNTETMLQQAQSQNADLQNVLYVHGDTQTAEQQGIRADCVVINMVLHHVPSPAAIFQDVAELLLAGGSLLIAELCHHDQNWVREACGDLWLGFEPEDLNHWAKGAQLVAGQERYLALRNGFQFQIRQFIKQ